MRSAFVALTMLMTACASEPVNREAAIQTPVERIYRSEVTKVHPDRSPVLVLRDVGGSQPPKCSTQLLLDGVHVADMRSGEMLTLWVTPKSHILGARMEQHCGRGVAEIALDPAQTVRTVRLSNNAANEPLIQFTAF